MWSCVCCLFNIFSSLCLSPPHLFPYSQGALVILECGSRPSSAFPHSSVCLFVYLWVDRRSQGGVEGRNGWGLGRGTPSGVSRRCWGWLGGEEDEEGKWVFAVNMMFILVMYLTVEDNWGLSVWLYEKNLNTNTKTFVDEHLREILLWKRFTFMGKKILNCSNI